MTDNILDTLKDIDKKTKPAGADDEWIRAQNYYDDTSREETRIRLQQLGMGLKDNVAPLEVNYLRSVIDGISQVYARPPTRFLRDLGGEKIPEGSPDQFLMQRMVERSQYDLAWRKVDRTRSLLRQACVRFYPHMSRGTAVARVFQPFNVIREPDPHAPDQMDNDRRFALCLRFSSTDELWELWNNTGAGWEVSTVDKEGNEVTEARPSPFGVLPVQMVYDEASCGLSWLPPKFSRTSWVSSINGILNDLLGLIVMQAHSEKIVATDDPAVVPTTTGPATVWVVPSDASVSTLTQNPKINECLNVLEGFLKAFLVSEDLPASYFDKTKSIHTGSSLRTLMQPLIARREGQVPLARVDEAEAWRRFAEVHNHHFAAVSGFLNPDLEMSVEIADMDIPTDQRETLDAFSRSIALGAKSSIDLIQKLDGVPRHVAIETWERVSEDLKRYPTVENPGALQEGPRLAGVDATPREDLDGQASVIDSVLARTANS